MGVVVYIISAFLLVIAALVVFRVFVRRDYQQKGRLTRLSGFLELLIWGLYMSFPYLYNPPEWAWFWSRDVPVSTPLRVIGVACIGVGLVLAFGTMAWFGMRRALGLEVNALIQIGPYRVTRNPQIVGGSLLVVGSTLLWPSWYALGWVVLYVIVAHTMVLTEEEHLRAVFGQGYERYCEGVPRYFGFRRRT
jgi:protein-S-isoprenylcysteine O-methyltransferase Ste14